MAPLLLISACGLAREIIAIMRETNYPNEVIGILDDNPDFQGRELDGVPVVGKLEAASRYPKAKFLVCTGGSAGRENAVRRLTRAGITGDRYVSFIDPSVTVPAGSHIGDGSIVLANVVMTTAVTVGDHAVVMPRVALAYDNVIGDFAILAAGAALGGQVTVGSGAYLGMNSSIRRGVSVGSRSSIGLGAAVLEDVPAGEKWGGVPAAPLSVRPVRTAAGDSSPGHTASARTPRSAFERLTLSASLLALQ
ncbi:NeuD/PglB/VioB family sugar acetyltransferase [Arthrobacter sp. CAN_A6]|uniref:NeuD/PglB/VioB family sugar acetyltransferase n=1 Tax=Arthrobacter sp. CAN_A6 TaxID=2787721 RepID=UPI0018CA3730